MEECAVPLDISDEVLQMYEEISEKGTYDYMICKCNNGRLVIEHIECLSRDIPEYPSSQAYEDFVKTLSRKRDFRYGFALYDTEIQNVSMRKTIAVAWFPSFGSRKRFHQTANVLRDVLAADLYLEASSEFRLSPVCIDNDLRKLNVC
ncbi:uncharacterized protein LOC111131727 isoform X2 [Crassostrea virginica]|uniref:Uncharacterized protein LOC111131727 isoform X2 n=1 Tax=Crassostrea virginica TaxID=6565 RepID=A0A8B8E6P9_CRAVI|nr:uncharacterized protein LOC111131727 isoform X2 [Crassostrea virginica]